MVSVLRDLTDTDVLGLRQQVLQDIRRYESRWVLLDFSLVDICDSFLTMVELGMSLPNIHAVLDLDDALALSREYKTREQAAEEASDSVRGGAS